MHLNVYKMKEQRRKMKAKLRQFELHTSNTARAQIANDDSQNTPTTQNTPITQNTQNTQNTPITPTTPTTPTIKKMPPDKCPMAYIIYFGYNPKISATDYLLMNFLPFLITRPL
jgi:hypothetical protein